MGITGKDLARERRKRIWLLWISLALVLIGVGLGVFFYKPWRAQNLHRAARAAMERGDYGDAAIKAQWALDLDPACAPAWVTLAEIGEHERLPEAVGWREHAMNLSGASTPALLAYASTALSFGKGELAKSTLDRVPGPDRQREDFLAVAGAVALDSGRNEEAARYYENAARTNPASAAYRLALGKAQAASADYLVREAGRRVLAELAADPALGVVALRTLIANCEAHQEAQAALRHTQPLVALPAHEFADEVLRLRLLRDTGDGGFGAFLTAVQKKAEARPADATTLLHWMNRADLAPQALEWVLKRSPQIGQLPAVRPALAGCHLLVGDWPALLASTQGGAWKTVEHIRHAYRAHAHRAQGDNSLARTEWNTAQGAAARKTDALAWLAEMAARWKWPDEMEQSLWAFLEQAPGNQWAIETLSKFYHGKGNTLGLRRIAVHLVKADPANENAQHDLAISSLLLGTEMERAKGIAKELHEKHPDNAVYTTTHAFALHCGKRTAEALAILESLPAQELEQPAAAMYYGILLAANDSPEKARRFLEIAREASPLPEEKVLVEKAEQMVAEPKP